MNQFQKLSITTVSILINLNLQYFFFSYSTSHTLDLQETCSADDINCLATASNDKLGLDAIRTLHQQLDDDANGNIDLTETSDVRILSFYSKFFIIN